jgi:Flp pilus assembly protein TadB
MTGWVWLAVLCAAAAAGLLVPVRPRLPSDQVPSLPDPGGADSRPGWLRLVAPPLCALATWQALGGWAGAVAGVVALVLARRVLHGAEPAGVRREREQAERDLPALVDLLAATLRSGAGPAAGLVVVCEAFPGPVSRRLSGVRGRLELGTPAGEAWRSLADDPVLAPLGRALARAEVTGASVVATVERLADELDSRALAAVEDRARGVGVRAAVPLGLCLLPGFLLLGIVPSVAGLLAGLL